MISTVMSGKSQAALLSDPQPPLPQTENVTTIPSGACGNCHQIARKSRAKTDILMLQCEIKTCLTWYHLSCIIGPKRGKSILFSHKMGTEDFHFVCTKCVNVLGDQYTDQVSCAIEHIKFTIEDVKNRGNAGSDAISEGSDAISVAYMYEPLAIARHRLSLGEHAYGLDDGSGMSQFALTRDEKFQGLEQSIITSLLEEIYQAIYNYDRQVCYTRQLLVDDVNTNINNPLEEWDMIDVGYNLTEGSEWFRLCDHMNTPSTSHKPITATLRQLLNTPQDKQLTISSELKSLPFSKIHMSLIYWFVLDILSSKINIYELPNMKPMRAMMAAVANFGDASKCS
jgi:hypothetical protein